MKVPESVPQNFQGSEEYSLKNTYPVQIKQIWKWGYDVSKTIKIMTMSRLLPMSFDPLSSFFKRYIHFNIRNHSVLLTDRNEYESIGKLK